MTTVAWVRDKEGKVYISADDLFDWLQAWGQTELAVTVLSVGTGVYTKSIET